MNTPTEFTRSAEFFVAEVAHQWVSSLDRNDTSEIHVNRLQRIDAESGILYDILEVRVATQMEKVMEESTSGELRTPKSTN